MLEAKLSEAGTLKKLLDGKVILRVFNHGVSKNLISISNKRACHRREL